MPSEGETPDNFEALVGASLELLDGGEPKKALQIGRRLEKLGYSSGFEIQGLAHRELDENAKAIGVLRRGIETVPDDWQLWQLFGNCLSDDEQYVEALTSYDTALRLPDSDRVSVGYNRSILLWRMGRLGDANSIVEALLNDAEYSNAEPEVQANIRAARLGILIDMGRPEDAVDYFETLPDVDEWSDHLSEVARLDAKYAIALWNDDRVDDARKALARAIRHDKTNADAQWLTREMHARDLPGGRYSFGLWIRGPWHAGAFPGMDPASAFHTAYQVVADNPEEALSFAREFESPHIRHALEIEEVMEKAPSDEPKGVYWTSAYQFHPED